MAEISVTALRGMNNIKDGERFFVEKGVAEPRTILNADVDVSGNLKKRPGQTLYVSLPGAHSLWAGLSCMLCVAGGKLYRIRQGQAEEISDVSGPSGATMHYEEAEDRVYLSNAYWQGIFTPSENAVADWGVTLPPGPMLTSTSGNLPAGTYHICMTNVSGDEISGNGPIRAYELTSEGGIEILNRPSGAIVWATDANESVFYKVGATDEIVDIPTVEPLPSFLCSPPPYMKNLCYAFGRMWGSVGKKLYYSEEYHPGWFKLQTNYFEFDSDITMIARVPSGLFIGMKDRTKFFHGVEPDKMQESFAGAGSIEGTLAYANNLPELGDVLGTPEKGYVDVPIWRTTEGIVAGNDSGRLFNLTKHKLKMGIPEQGASLYRMVNGVFQFLTSASAGVEGSGKGSIDDALKTIFANGQIATSAKSNNRPETVAAFTDEVECEVRRGGELI